MRVGRKPSRKAKRTSTGSFTSAIRPRPQIDVDDLPIVAGEQHHHHREHDPEQGLQELHGVTFVEIGGGVQCHAAGEKRDSPFFRAAGPKTGTVPLFGVSRSPAPAPRTGCRSGQPALLLGEDGAEGVALQRGDRVGGEPLLLRHGRIDDVDQPVGAVQAAPQIVVLAIGAAEEGAEAVELEALQRRVRAAACGSRPRRWARSGRP